MLSGCVSGSNPGNSKATYHTGPEIEVGPLSIALTVDSAGNVVLSGTYSQKLIGIKGLGGISWTTGFEKVLYAAQNDANSLFILWKDSDGNMWQEEYQIGKPFKVTFNDDSRVREIRSDQQGNVVVAVEPVGEAPNYDDLRDDIRDLVVRWDKAHKEADGPTWDTSGLSSVLQGAALREQLATVSSLKNRNCYWTIDELMKPQITRFEVNSSTSLLVEVRKNWDMDLYCNGRKSGDDDGYFTMRYDMQKLDGQWYITQKKVASTQ